MHDSRRDRRENDREDDGQQVAVHARNGIAEHETRERESYRPEESTDNIEGEEAGVMHTPDTCEDRREGAHDGHEARENDGFAAVLLVKFLGAPEGTAPATGRGLPFVNSHPPLSTP